jgi:hypothetical protein
LSLVWRTVFHKEKCPSFRNLLNGNHLDNFAILVVIIRYVLFRLLHESNLSEQSKWSEAEAALTK